MSYLSVLVAPPMEVVSFVGILLIVGFANARSLLVDRTLEATTSAALLVIFVLGALAGQGHLFTPVASAILMTMLLAWKVELHRFAGGLEPAEIRSAVLLGLLGLVVYPLLPDRFIDPWQLINPRQIIAHRNPPRNLATSLPTPGTIPVGITSTMNRKTSPSSMFQRSI